MNCEVRGKITAELEVRTGTRDGKDWEVREYLITEQSQFGKTMKFSMTSWDGPIMDRLQIGDSVCVSFSVSAREHEGKWYNDVRAWKVQRLQS